MLLDIVFSRSMSVLMGATRVVPQNSEHASRHQPSQSYWVLAFQRPFGRALRRAQSGSFVRGRPNSGR
jgi:hypothetical protein